MKQSIILTGNNGKYCPHFMSLHGRGLCLYWPDTCSICKEREADQNDRPMTEYDPTYDYHADPIAILYIRSELRLVVDLQNNIKAQQSEAYARKVRLSNMQEMARTVVYIQEQGIGSREELRARQEEAHKAPVADSAVPSRRLGRRVGPGPYQLHLRKPVLDRPAPARLPAAPNPAQVHHK